MDDINKALKLILEEMAHDLEHSKKTLESKRQERLKLDVDIKYYEGVCDGSNFTINILKNRIVEDK